MLVHFKSGLVSLC